ncbi:MAG: SRPBCC family protein [Bacteroidota bacterium]|nr:SRPBCC family protein [Bacteroidota bacterium]
MTYPVKNISVSINKPADKVYQFASNPENFPVWVEFINSMNKETEEIWFAETNMGNLKIEFVPKNEFGVIDHLVTLPDGSTVNNPIRVIANGKGSELVFTLFWMPNRTEEEFNQDAKLVENDLKKIKQILETE